MKSYQFNLYSGRFKRQSKVKGRRESQSIITVIKLLYGEKEGNQEQINSDESHGHRYPTCEQVNPSI